MFGSSCQNYAKYRKHKNSKSWKSEKYRSYELFSKQGYTPNPYTQIATFLVFVESFENFQLETQLKFSY